MPTHDIVMAAASGATPQTYWTATVGGDGAEQISQSKMLAVDSFGNAYFACGVNTSGVYTGRVGKYNSSGVLQWQRQLSGLSYCYINAVTLDSENNVYVVGGATTTGGTGDVGFVIKYNNSGVLQWQRAVDGSGTEDMKSVATDSSNNVYAVGSETSQGAGSGDALLVKYDSSGTLQWQRILGGTGFDSAYGVTTDGSNVYMCGRANADGFVAKYNSSGTLQWQRQLTSTDDLNTVVADQSGNIYVTGYTPTAPSGPYLVKYDTSGVRQWQRTFGVASNGEAFAMALDSDGYIYICGDYGFIAKYDSSGNLVMQRQLLVKNSAYFSGLGVVGSSMYLLAGAYDNGFGQADLAIYKLPTDGSLTSQIGNATYQSSSYTSSTANTVDSAGTLTASTSTLTSLTPSITDAAGTAGSMTMSIVQPYYFLKLAGTYSQYSYGVQTDLDGNIYVAGYGQDNFASLNQGYISKYDNQGNQLWTTSPFQSGNISIYESALDSSNNLYVVGTYALNIVILKYNSSGTLQWQRSLSSASTDSEPSVAVDSSGNVYVSCTVYATDIYGVAAKYDTSGTLLWQRSLSLAGTSVFFRAIAVDESGNVYVTGTGTALLIVKYNTSGTIQWQRTMSGTGNATGEAIDVSGGYVYVAGTISGQGAGNLDVYVTRFTTAGVFSWQKMIGGASNDVAYGIYASDYVAYIAGYTESQGAGTRNGFIARLSDFTGSVETQVVVGSSGQVTAFNGIYVNPVGNLYVTGSGGSVDILTAQFPANLTLTGTYGSYVYATSTLTVATPTLASGTPTLTDAAGALTSAAGSLGTTSMSYTKTKTLLQGT